MIPHLNIPLVSVVFMLLAGILIGHLIWYRDRSEEEAQIDDLRGENDDLRSALQEHQAAYQELEQDLDSRQADWERHKALNQKLSQAHADAEKKRSDLSQELSRLHQLKDQAFHDLDQERQQRRELESTVARVQAQPNTSANFLEPQTSKHADLDHRLQDAQTRIAELETLLEQAQHAAQQTQAQCDQLAAHRDSLNDQWEHATQQLQLVEQKGMHSHADLELRLESTIGQLEAITKQRDVALIDLTDHRHSLKQIQRDLDERHRDIESLRAERDGLLEQRDEARSERDVARQSLPQVTHLVSQRDSTFAKLSDAMKAHQSLESNIQHHEISHSEMRQKHEILQEEHQLLIQQHEALAQALTNEQHRVAQFELSSQELSGRMEGDRAEYIEQLHRLQNQLNSKSGEIAAIRATLEETATKLAQERHQREHLQLAIDARQQQIEALQNDNAVLQDSRHELSLKSTVLLKHSEELQSLRGEHAAVLQMFQEQTERFTGPQGIQAEFHQLQTAIRDLQQERQSHLDEISQLQNSVQTSSHNIASLEQERDDQLDELSALRQRVALLSEEATRLDSLQQELNDIECRHLTNEASKRDLQKQLDELHATLQEAVSERDSLHDEVTNLRERISQANKYKEAHAEQMERLEKLLFQRDEALSIATDKDVTIEDLRNELSTKDQSLHSLEEEIQFLNDRVTAMVDEHETQLVSLRADLQTAQPYEQQLERLREQYDNVEHRLEEANQLLAQALRERDEHAIAHRTATRQLEAFQTSLTKTADLFDEDSDREIHATLPMPHVSLSRALPTENANDGRMRRDDVLGMVYVEPPQNKDDLKKISGVATVLEKKLNAFGVYTYKQVMEWDDVAVQEFSKLLSFRDRIQRDDWMGQARQLYYDHYGRAA